MNENKDIKETKEIMDCPICKQGKIIEKKTKKGVRTVDIKPDVNVISCTFSEKSADMVMRLPAGTQANYNPSLFIEALRKSTDIPFEAIKICRTGIFCENGEIFS